ncbi:MAG: hypothetical protein ABW212_01115, partial [Pseudonocardia sediminis]
PRRNGHVAAPQHRRGIVVGVEDGTNGAPSLHKVRVRLPDESGALARLTAAVAGAGGNILSLSVDAPTRALDLVSPSTARDDGPAQGVAALLHADEVLVVPEPPGPESDHVLVLPAPSGDWLVARRAWAPFTVTETARAAAFLRAVTVVPPRAGYTVMLCSGEELTAHDATGDEVAELDALLRTCLAVLPGVHEVIDWTAADLRSVLLPPGGGCLTVRTVDGTLVALGSVLTADELDPSAGAEPVLLVHPLHRGHHLGRWLRRTLAAHVLV